MSDRRRTIRIEENSELTLPFEKRLTDNIALAVILWIVDDSEMRNCECIIARHFRCIVGRTINDDNDLVGKRLTLQITINFEEIVPDALALFICRNQDRQIRGLHNGRTVKTYSYIVPQSGLRPPPPFPSGSHDPDQRPGHRGMIE